MIAPALLPEKYREWNAHWSAPRGTRFAQWKMSSRMRVLSAPLVGMFAFQENNSTRAYEYPWAFFATPLERGMRALEIGGGLSGFQFVLSRYGIKVTNVDPGLKARGRGWPVGQRTFKALNVLFRTDVALKACFVEEADLAAASLDRVYSISTFEHIPEQDLQSILKHAAAALKPGGYLVATVDLFLNVRPFASEEENEFGRNVSVKWIIEQSGLNMVQGTPAELFGFAEFDPERITRLRNIYFIGEYPALVQAFVLRKDLQ